MGGDACEERVQVDVPDVKGRVAILNVHARNKKLDDEVDLEQIALRTPGFSGAVPVLVCPAGYSAFRGPWSARNESVPLSNTSFVGC